MPYLRLDISEPLATTSLGTELLVPLNQLTAEILAIPIQKVKTTTATHRSVCVGDDLSRVAAYLTVQLFTGRPTELRSRLSKALYDHLERYWKNQHPAISLSVYVLEIDPAGTTTAQHRPLAA